MEERRYTVLRSDLRGAGERRKRGVSSLLAALLTLAALALSPQASAQPPTAYSYILKDTAYATNPEVPPTCQPPADPLCPKKNSIFGYDPVTRMAVVTSNRLANALEALALDVQVDALSYGWDQIDTVVPHGDIHFGVARMADGSTGACPRTPLWNEPTTECEADFFQVENKPALSVNSKGSHNKSLDDNGTSAPKASYPYLNFVTLGLTGTVGTPNNSAPDVANVCGFDIHEYGFANTADIYFSIDQDTAAFKKGDILQLDATDTITVWKSFSSLGLQPGDDIDALSIDIHHSPLVPQDIVGIYSLTPTSPSIVHPRSGADLFRFFLNTSYTSLALQLYRTGPSNGFILNAAPASGDGDIDSVVSIDPRKLRSTRDLAVDPSTGTVTPEPPSIPESYTISRNGVREGTWQGSEGSVALPSGGFPAGSFDILRVDETICGRDRVGGSVVVSIPSPVDPVLDLAATLAGPTSATWTWSEPVAYDAVAVRLDRQPLEIIPAGTLSYTATGLFPGVHTLSVQGIDGSVASPAALAAAFVDGDLAGPEDVDAVVTGRDVEFTWVQAVLLDDVEFTFDDLPAISIGPGVIGTNSAVLPGVDYGRHVVELRGVLAGERSHAAIAELVVQRPLPGDVIQSTPFDGTTPSGVTVAPGTNLILVADADGPLAYAYDGDDLTSGSILSIAQPAGPVTGVAYHPESPLLPGDDLLYWAITVGTGSELWGTDLLGASPQLIGAIDVAGVAGDLDVDPDTAELWVAAPESGQVVLVARATGAALGPVRSNPAGAGGSGVGVAVRDDGAALEIPTGAAAAGGVTDIALVDALDEVRTGTPLPGIVAGELRGIASTPAGSTGIRALYAAAAGATPPLVAEIAAHAVVPDEEDCHLPILGGTAQVASGALDIPDDAAAPLVATLSVSDDRSILDLDVAIHIEHPDLSELIVTLTGPSGDEVTLHGLSLSLLDGLRARYDDLLSGGFNDRSGELRPLSGSLAQFDGQSAQGTWTLTVTDTRPGNTGTLESWGLLLCSAGGGVTFRRGDANGDGGVDLGDAIFTLDALFGSGGGTGDCPDAHDANDDGQVDIGDPVFALSWLFIAGSSPPPAPGPDTCGEDPTPDGLGCLGQPSCP